MSKNENLTGQRFGKLVVREKGPPKIYSNGSRRTTWICNCDCGRETIVIGSSLKNGSTKSCGCIFLNFSKNKRKENKYDLSGNYGIGYTDKGESFYFDLEDYEKIKNIYWGKTTQGYMGGRIPGTGGKIILMHRLIMDAPSDKLVDHIGGENTMTDNRKENLRIVEHVHNSLNHKLYGHNKSGTTGVYWVSQAQKWEAVVTINGKKKRLGQYKTKEEAIEARKLGERMYYKEYGYEASQELYKGGIK